LALPCCYCALIKRDSDGSSLGKIIDVHSHAVLPFGQACNATAANRSPSSPVTRSSRDIRPRLCRGWHRLGSDKISRYAAGDTGSAARTPRGAEIAFGGTHPRSACPSSFRSSSSPPASSRATRTFGSWLRRAASKHPAEPTPRASEVNVPQSALAT
jgi:hypothetical protein